MLQPVKTLSQYNLLFTLSRHLSARDWRHGCTTKKIDVTRRTWSPSEPWCTPTASKLYTIEAKHLFDAL